MISIEYIELKEIKPYKKNARKNDRAVGIVKKSIQEFGFKNPIILDKNNEIIAGHTRLKAAKELDMKKVPVIWARDLSPEQVKAFRIMDNKSQEFSSWDDDLLAEEFNDLEKTDAFGDTGFSNKEITDIWESVEKEESYEPEVEFTQELLESHNYLVLYFDNEMDWQVAKEKFNIKPKQGLASRPGFEKKGVGRVLKGSDILKRLDG